LLHETGQDPVPV